MRARRSLVLAITCVGLACAIPADAPAGSVTVTDDAGQPAPLTEGSPLQLRQLAPAVAPVLSAAEKRYTLTVTGPDGKSAGVDSTCIAADGAGRQNVSYAGNGSYAVKLVTYTAADDIYCEGTPTTQNFAFVIAASVTLTGPASPFQYRTVGGGEQNAPLRYDLNPGALRYRFTWAFNATFGAGGAIVGDYDKGDFGERGISAPSGSLGDVRFSHTGVVSIVAAAEAPNGNPSPFSAPVTLKVIGPFDWSETPGFTGGRGATHVIEGQVYEPGTIGKKVSVLLAKGSGTFKPFVTKTIPATRKLSFKIRKARGTYRLKYVFKGADFVAAGAWTQRLRIGKGSSASLSRITVAR